MASTDSKLVPLRLATTPQRWREMDQVIEDSVQEICRHYNAKTVHAFMFLIDILTNENIDRCDKEIAADRVQKLAFTYSPRFDHALEEYLNEINPGRIQRRRKAVSA